MIASSFSTNEIGGTEVEANKVPARKKRAWLTKPTSTPFLITVVK